MVSLGLRELRKCDYLISRISLHITIDEHSAERRVIESPQANAFLYFLYVTDSVHVIHLLTDNKKVITPIK